MHEIQQYIELSPVACLIFGMTLISSFLAFRDQKLMTAMMLNPYRMVHHKKYYEVLTSGLVHADFMHLAFNMLSFYFFAIAFQISSDNQFELKPLEVWMTERAGQIGHLYFGLIYIVSMVLGDLSTIIKQRDNPQYFSLGASGAISGIIFSYILFAPQSKLSFFFLPTMPAPLFAVVFVIISIWGAKSRHSNINHDAHLWGGLFGFALTVALFPGIFQEFLIAVKNLLHFF